MIVVLGWGCSAELPALTGEQPLGSESDTAAGDSAGEDTAAPADTAETGDTAEGAGWSSPCTTYAAPEQTGTVVDGALDELSGLAASWRNPDLLWTLEDHAGAAAVYGLDPSGATVVTVNLDGQVNNDWESLAVGPCGDTTCVFVADSGDNQHDRDWHGILRFPEPERPDGGTATFTLTPSIFPYVYPDEPWDSEGMFVQPDGRPVLLTKELASARTALYVFPALEADVTATLEYVAEVATGDEGEGAAAAVTGADLWPDATRLLVRTYGHIWEYSVPDGDLSRLAEGTRTALGTGTEKQGEAITYDAARGAFYTVSEGAAPPIWRVPCGG